MPYKIEMIKKLSTQIKAEGFRVFIAKSGTYGFYTNDQGSKIVSFQCDLGSINFSGNYKSKTCGAGWRMASGMSLQAMINAGVPYWATKGELVKLTTLQEHLDTYQKSSNYTEI